jgi:ligand-binding sensor domain-containing protein
LIRVKGSSARLLVKFGSKTDLSPGSLAVDASGDIWFGTADNGVGRIHGGKVEFARADDSSPSIRSTKIFVDREGSIWVGSTSGLLRLNRPAAYLMSIADGMPPGMPRFVFADSHDRLWMASDQLVVRLDLETGTRQTTSWQAQHAAAPFAIGEDREGRIWVSDETNLYSFQDGRWIVAKDDGGAPIPRVLSIMRLHRRFSNIEHQRNLVWDGTRLAALGSRRSANRI